MSEAASVTDAAPSSIRGRTPAARRGPASGASAAHSLQARITAAILLTAVAVLAMGCTLFMLEQHRSERLEESKAARQLSQILATLEGPYLQSGDTAGAKRVLGLLGAFPRINGARVVSINGALQSSYRRPGADKPTMNPIRSPIVAGGRRLGELTVDFAPKPTTIVLSHYLAMGGALFFAAVAVALFLGRWLSARITTPMARLSQAMDAVGRSGELRIRVAPDAPDEIGRLTERFNELMERLYLKDVALHRTLGELVEARDASEAANLAKSQFLANMSHEIRTPLNGVLAMAQILERGAVDEAKRGQAQVIRQSGEMLLSLLNDMLDVSKIEAGRLELETSDFELEPVVRDAVAAFTAVAGRKGLALSVEIAGDAMDVRRGDAARLRQVLNNFVSNALKFTEAGGVSVRIRGEGAGGADGLSLEVRDTGIGIAREKLPLVFQKFVQVDASTTRRFGGSGLGLAICEELCALMGGRVWVESEPGLGSTFHASLPMARVGSAVAVAAPPTSGVEASSQIVTAAEEDTGVQPPLEPAAVASAGALRVLAAEDNATNQLVISTIMQIFGFELTLAGDGEEAVQRWRDGGFDVVLMDIQMPRMDGVAATRAIRAQEAAEGLPRTPILALSANALPQQVAEYVAAGMDGHIAKPIELAKLQAALEDVLSQGEVDYAESA